MEEKQRKMLLELRSKLVGKLHVQPFTIYDDKTIEVLLQKKPKTLKELSAIKGFPETGKRIRGFGDLIVAIFTDVDRISDIEISGDDTSLSIQHQIKPITAF